MWAWVLLQHANRDLPPEYRGYPVRVRGEFEYPPVEDEFALRLVTGDEDNERVVSSVEFVSPANKSSPESRRVFMTRCVELLRRQVCVTLVDIVTAHDFNLYTDLMDFLGHADPGAGTPPCSLYAVTLRPRIDRTQRRIEAWTHQLSVGQALPTIPIFISDTACLPLDLEATYEETCDTLRIRD
jgi:hypothetical protein